MTWTPRGFYCMLSLQHVRGMSVRQRGFITFLSPATAGADSVASSRLKN